MSADVVRVWIDDTFADRWIGLETAAQRGALERLEQLGVSGGATYDGLIAIVAATSGATLVSLDRRALSTYQRLDARVELIG